MRKTSKGNEQTQNITSTHVPSSCADVPPVASVLVGGADSLDVDAAKTTRVSAQSKKSEGKHVRKGVKGTYKIGDV